MSLARFRRLTELHGGDLSRWPERERSAAAALLAASPEARAALADAAALDGWLDTAAGPVTDAQVERVLGRLHRELADESLPLPPPPSPPTPALARWAAIGFIAAMGMLGYVAGDPAHRAPNAGLADLVASSPSYIVAWQQ